MMREAERQNADIDWRLEEGRCRRSPAVHQLSADSSSTIVADVIERLHDFDIEAAVARHVERLAGAIFAPFTLTRQTNAASSARHIHFLRRLRRKLQRRGKNHP